MKKNKDDIFRDDAEFISNYIKENGSQPSVPASASEEVIVKMIDGKKQKKNTRAIVGRSVVSVLAAALVVCGILVANVAIYNPHIDTSSGVAYAESYSQVVSLMKDYNNSKNFSSFFSDNRLHLFTTTDYAEETASEDSNGTGSVSSADSSYSLLNTREDDVDESDVVRTDGEYIYVTSPSGGGALIIKPETDGTMSVVSTIDCETAVEGDSSVSPQQLFIYGNYLLIVAECDSFEGTRVLFYDITDKANPVFVKSVGTDGYFTAARITDGRLILVTIYLMSAPGEYNEENCIPHVYENGEASLVGCNDIIIPDTAQPDVYNIALTLDLDDSNAVPSVQAILGSGWEVYCTNDRLFIYGENYSDEDSWFTDVKCFEIGGDGIAYKCCCKFDGYIYNTFSIDWNGETLRAAVSRNDDNALYILDGDLNELGSVTGFGKDENIYGVRFIDDMAYVVTYENTDPLYVIDLSDSSSPVIVGELTMPGFSDYLHPVGDGLLLGIGLGGDEDGLDGSSKASLYDISDPANPKELSSVTLPDTWTNTEYKAFTKVPGENAYLIPVEKTVYDNELTGDEDGSYYYPATFYTGAVKITIGDDNTLSVSTEYLTDTAVYDDCYISTDRAIVIGSNVYTVDSACLITSWAEDGSKLSSLKLTGFYPHCNYDYGKVYCYTGEENGGYEEDTDAVCDDGEETEIYMEDESPVTAADITNHDYETAGDSYGGEPHNDACETVVASTHHIEE